ncbi:hypothetical protein F4801DRAFT_542315 [Xylaria longipes]|nr:hypothetical protein F4801DRAFT_542315 [Xylaria longipes]
MLCLLALFLALPPVCRPFTVSPLRILRPPHWYQCVRIQFSSTRPEEPKYVHYALRARSLVRDPANKFFSGLLRFSHYCQHSPIHALC